MPYTIYCFGEILWDILPGKTLPGGAPMNVAYHLQRHAIPAALITRVGNDSYGQQLTQLMEQQGLTTSHVQTDPVHETGKVYAKMDANHEMQYEIVQPVAWDFITLTPALQQLQRHNMPYLVFGSLAARSNISRSTLFALLEKAGQLVLDINLRPPHYSRELVETLLQHCNLLKLNEHELALIAGWYGLQGSQEEMVRLLGTRFNIPSIIITMGEKGAALFTDQTFYQHPGFRVTVADTIGSGDAFLAGYLHTRMNGGKAPDALAYACALGALVATYPGGCPEYQLQEVKALMRR